MKEFIHFAMKPHFLLSAFAFCFGSLAAFFGEDFYSLHLLWFLDIALLSAYTGFLFTALPAWLGLRINLAAFNVLILLVLLLAIILSFFSINLAFALAIVAWCILLLTCVFLCLKARQYMFILPIIFAFYCLKIAYFLSENEIFLRAIIHLNSLALVIITFRIQAAISRSALDLQGLFHTHFFANVYVKNLGILLAVFCILASCFDRENPYFFAAFGFLLLASLKDLGYKNLLKIPYMLGFFIIRILLAFSYFLLALDKSASYLHALCLIGIAGHIFMIFNIAGLRHFGKELVLTKSAIASFCLLFVALYLRVFSENFTLAIIVFALSALLQLVQLAKTIFTSNFVPDA